MLTPARRVRDQNGRCAESPSNPAYPPCTACGLLEACSRGRCRRYTEGFRGGLDSLLSIAGKTLPERCDPHSLSLRLVCNPLQKPPFRNFHPAPALSAFPRLFASRPDR